MTHTPIRETARGRWKGILSALGVESRYLTGKNTPCPICRDQKLRFRFTDRNGDGMWICSNCGAHDGVTLLMMLHGKDFRQVAADVESIIGTVDVEPQKPERSEAEKLDDMARLWKASVPIAHDDAAGRYLTRRTGLVAYPGSLRFVQHRVWTADHPAMLAKVVGVDGKAVQLHRTLLAADGSKAAVENPRRMMPGTVPKGSAVRLFKAAEELGIAEGLETALSAANLFGMPCWAALNAGMLESWTPPAEVKRVVVFGDSDASFTGQFAAFALARRLRLAGLQVEVRIPETIGQDWNDVWVAQNASEVVQ